MRLIKAIATLISVFFIINGPAIQRAWADDDAAAIGLIHRIHRAASSNSLSSLRATIDAPAIARTVLGNYWQSANANERKNFTDALADAIVAALVRRFSGQAKADLTILGSRKLGNGDILVRTQIARSESNTMNIDWRTRACSSGACLADVITDGASALIQRREEFTTRLANGGSIADLISTLRATSQSSGLR